MKPRVIVLDTFPLSSVAKREPVAGAALTALDRCREWVIGSLEAGHRIVTPAVAYYEVLRELERLSATARIARLRTFCRDVPGRYLSLSDANLDLAARLLATARNAGLPTASLEALDCDVLLAAQVSELAASVRKLSIGLRHFPSDFWPATAGPWSEPVG